MPKIICKLPNASTNLNGVEFEKHEAGVISKEDVAEEHVSLFLSVPGFVTEEDHAAELAAKKGAKKGAAKDEKPAA